MSESEAGINIIRRIYQICQVDDEWSVWDKRGYAWWGHRLAQRLWVDDPIEDDGFTLYPLHARTDLLRGVEVNGTTLSVLAGVNSDATYGAICLDPETGDVFAHTRYNCHAENQELAEEIFKPAAALQIAYAHQFLHRLQQEIGGTPCYTEHPTSGQRDEPDDMLNVAVAFQAAGQGDALDLYDEFARLQEMGKRVSAETNIHPEGLTAEFPFNRRLQHPMAKGMPMTALFRLKTDYRHPFLGAGLLSRLDLPCLEARPDIANAMNLQASQSGEIENMMGAWTCDERTLYHQVFIPNLSLKPGLAMNCFMYGLNRCEWSSRFCEEQGLIDEVLNAPPKAPEPPDAFTAFMLQVAQEAGPGASREELRALVMARLQELPDGYFKNLDA